MKILVTGSRGFIGKNLCAQLRNLGYNDLLEYNTDTDQQVLGRYTHDCDFVFHLAGVSTPSDRASLDNNRAVTALLLQNLRAGNNKAPVVMTSSLHADGCSPYGLSKQRAEQLLEKYGDETGAPVYIYRLPDVFGKWCRPNHNNMVATFCNAAAYGLPIAVINPEEEVKLAYIDDVVEELIGVLQGKRSRAFPYNRLHYTYRIKAEDLKDLIISFRNVRRLLIMPDLDDPFISKLYSTFISYLPEVGLSAPLPMLADSTGRYIELISAESAGQVAVRITKPGAVTGNLWHHTKIEKIYVISGTGHVLFRQLDDDKIFVYRVSGDNPAALDVPPGFIHTVLNTGDVDLISVVWSSHADNDPPDIFSKQIDT